MQDLPPGLLGKLGYFSCSRSNSVFVSDFSVTPPKVIDQVWHEHLLFSRAYREFCHEVLSREFDHNPELVETDDQTQAFQAQYAATLALYQSFDDEALLRRGTANGQPMSVRALGHVIAGHEAHHVAILRERYGLSG